MDYFNENVKQENEEPTASSSSYNGDYSNPIGVQHIPTYLLVNDPRRLNDDIRNSITAASENVRQKIFALDIPIANKNYYYDKMIENDIHLIPFIRNRKELDEFIRLSQMTSVALERVDGMAIQDIDKVEKYLNKLKCLHDIVKNGSDGKQNKKGQRY